MGTGDLNKRDTARIQVKDYEFFQGLGLPISYS